MNVSIIIVTYNTKKLTLDCIQSIIDHTSNLEYEIIVVDNASTDGSKDTFESDNRIRYIYSETNGGFGYGNNLGMKIAKGKYVFLLNSDTLLQNNAIKEFFDYAEKQQHPTCYGCYLVDKSGELNSPAFYFPRFTIKEFLKDKFSHVDYCYNIEKVMEVQCVCGAAMFFAKAIIDVIGEFDEHIFMYGEEGELQYRMKEHGIGRMLIPGPQIVHFGGGSQEDSSDSIHKLFKKNLFRSHFIILKKHMNLPTYYIARAYYSINVSLRYLPKAIFCDRRYFIPIKQVLSI